MRFATTVAMVAVTLMAGGCGSGPKIMSLPLSVKPGESLKGSAIRVHLVGVQDPQVDRYAKYPVDQWFAPDDQLRQTSVGRTIEMRFDAMAPGPQTIDAKNPVWQKWKADGVTNVVIFANLPSSGAAPGQEPGKYVLPLDSRRWESAKDVMVEVKPDTITVRPPPGPAK